MNEIDRTFPVMETHRGVAELATRENAGWSGLARWDYTRFNFDGLRGDATGDVHRVTIAASDSLWGWGVGLDLVYTDTDYASTPDALAIGESYFPEDMPPGRYYHPVPRGLELRIREKLEDIERRKREAQSQPKRSR